MQVNGETSTLGLHDRQALLQRYEISTSFCFCMCGIDFFTLLHYSVSRHPFF